MLRLHFGGPVGAALNVVENVSVELSRGVILALEELEIGFDAVAVLEAMVINVDGAAVVSGVAAAGLSDGGAVRACVLVELPSMSKPCDENME